MEGRYIFVACTCAYDGARRMPEAITHFLGILDAEVADGTIPAFPIVPTIVVLICPSTRWVGGSGRAASPA